MEERSDLPAKFSNDIYATQQDVIDALQMRNIDSVWGKILEYRNFFSMSLNLNNADGKNYSVVLTPVISQKVNAIERRLFKAMSNFENLNESAKQELIKEEQRNILSTVALNLINVNEKQGILVHYVNALNDIKDIVFNEINDDFIKKMSADLSIETELSNSKEEVTNSLYAFIKNNYISAFVKASCALYYVLYTKPFENYNEELGILLFKEILAHYDFGPVSSLINVESVLSNIEEIEKTIEECQINLDLTYFLNYMLTKIDICMDNILNDIISFKTKTIQRETYSLDEANDSTPIENLSRSVVSSGPLAISITRNSLSEEEARQLEISLQELIPELRPMQAAFYARHCTLGSKYTIRQFQKFNSCSYETARSSMDKLVNLGFYRKEPLKNKFIYTPIERK